MRFYYLLLALLIFSAEILSAKKFEIIPGFVGLSDSNARHTSRTTVNYFAIENDTMTALFNAKYLSKYYNQKWNVVDSNIQQYIYDNINDTEFKKKFKTTDIIIKGLQKNKTNNYWYSFALPENDMIYYFLYCTKDKNYLIQKYFYADSNRDVKIQECSISFDNDNVPYFIFNDWKWNVDDENYSIFKMENDTLKHIYDTHSLPAGKYYASNSLNHKLLFDSKNNFWTYSEDNIYYFTNDTINKKFDTWSIPKELTSQEKSPGIDCMYLYKDDLIVVNKDRTIATLINGEWQIDYEFRYYCENADENLNLNKNRNNKFNSYLKGNKLWVYLLGSPYILVKDLDTEKWTYHLMPPGLGNFAGFKAHSGNYLYTLNSNIINYHYYNNKIISNAGLMINIEE